ncbi:unnamed protein product [Caenorhabditis sp. 36 PRJEB53466]|nr:unnamed protein product [Caenorhabditis sp. 36 PRJEB53466]
MLLLVAMTLLLGSSAEALFFGGGGGCGCRPQQCSCAPQPVAQNYCPPSPCGRSYPSFPSYQSYPSYSPAAYRPPPLPISQPFYAVPQPIPIQTTYQNSYQQPLLTGSYNAPYSSVQNAPIQVSSAKSMSETSSSDVFGDTVVQKSKSLSSVKNDLDEDSNALSNFETSLLAYKSMGRNGIRRAQGTKIEKPEKCSSSRLQEIMEKAMTSNVSVSKLKISQGAKREFGYNFDVICSQFDFSYLISSNIYCRVEMDGQTCLAYEN